MSTLTRINTLIVVHALTVSTPTYMPRPALLRKSFAKLLDDMITPTTALSTSTLGLSARIIPTYFKSGLSVGLNGLIWLRSTCTVSIISLTPLTRFPNLSMLSVLLVIP